MQRRRKAPWRHAARSPQISTHLSVVHTRSRVPCSYCRCRRALALLRDRGHVAGGQQVVLVQSGRRSIWRAASTHAIQARGAGRWCACTCLALLSGGAGLSLLLEGRLLMILAVLEAEVRFRPAASQTRLVPE